MTPYRLGAKCQDASDGERQWNRYRNAQTLKGEMDSTQDGGRQNPRKHQTKRRIHRVN